MRMLNHVPLLMQIRQRARADGLGLERNALTLAQSLPRPAQAVGAGQELLSLLELVVSGVGLRVVGVAVTKEGFAVGGGGE